MTIEISLSKALAGLLGLDNLEKSKLDESNPYHYYADIFTRNRQKTIIFMNTSYYWMFVSNYSTFKKNPLFTFEDDFINKLRMENIKEYLGLSYLKNVTDIKFTLSNSRSITARLCNYKKNYNYFYDHYYDVPDLLILDSQRNQNKTIMSTPHSKNLDDYFIPFEEFLYYLTTNFINTEIEEKDHEKYYEIKNDNFKNITPKTFTNISEDEISKTCKKYHNYLGQHIYLSPYVLYNFVSKNQYPTVEECYDFILKRDCLGFTEIIEQKALCDFFNVPWELFVVYSQKFNMEVTSKLSKLDVDGYA